MRSRRSVGIGALGALLLAAAATPAQAQTPGLLRGHLVDGSTLEPLYGAFIALESANRGVLSDTTGYFALPVARAPYYVVRVRQLGYRDLSMTITAESAQEALVFQLEPDPVKIEGLRVLVERFEDRRRGPFGAVDVLTQKELIHAPDGAASDLVRRQVPFARLCDPMADDEKLCVNTQGRSEPLTICVDNHRVSEQMVELEHLDPRGLYMVEVYRRTGQVRIYTRGYVERLVASGEDLPPLSFGCGSVGMPGDPIGG